jgi:hypothetical protein
VAGYIAKYATKATESFGAGLDRRLTADDDLDRLDKLPANVAKLVRPAGSWAAARSWTGCGCGPGHTCWASGATGRPRAADPKLGRITLAEWAERWQATTANLRPTTRDLYSYLLRRFLLPTSGKAAPSIIDALAVRVSLTKLQAEA